MLAQKSFTPGNVLAAILFRYPEEKFENDREKLHSAFFEIRKNHFSLLKDFVFKDNVLFPRSRVLDEVLASLQPGFLGKINPTFEAYEIKRDKLKMLWERELKTSLGEKNSEIEEIAKELKKLLS